MSSAPPESRFRANSISLAKYISSLRIKDISVSSTRIAQAYLLGSNECVLIKNFIKHSRSSWAKIREKDEDFMLHNAQKLFGMYSSSDIDPIINAINSEYIDENQKGIVWSYFQSLVRIAIHWIARNAPDDEIHEESRAWGVNISKDINST